MAALTGDERPIRVPTASAEILQLLTARGNEVAYHPRASGSAFVFHASDGSIVTLTAEVTSPPAERKF